MPTFNVSQGILFRPASILDTLTSTITDAVDVAGDDTTATMLLGASPVTISGTGFTYALVDGETALVAGVIDAVHIDFFNLSGYDIDYSDLALDVEVFRMAVTAEQDGQTWAVNTLLLSQDWRYTGNSAPDQMPPGSTETDGTPIRFNGNDWFDLEFGDDVLAAGAGDDTVLAGMGSDTIYGSFGNDFLRGQEGDDLLFGDDGDDFILGDYGRDTLSGGAGDDRIFAGYGHDTVTGGDGADSLRGNALNDLIFGGAGADTLDGGTGDDTLVGGADADRFVFRAGDGQDTLRGFESGVDVLVLEGITSFELVPDGRGVVLQYGEDSAVLLTGLANGIVTEDDILLI